MKAVIPKLINTIKYDSARVGRIPCKCLMAALNSTEKFLNETNAFMLNVKVRVCVCVCVCVISIYHSMYIHCSSKRAGLEVFVNDQMSVAHY
jgi:hypothetical protein